MVPLDLADRLSVVGGAAGRRGHPPRRRASIPGPLADNLVLRAIAAARARRATRLGPPRAAARRSPPASTSGSRSPRASRAARPTPPRPPTRRSRRGASTLDDEARHAAVRAARLGRPVLPRRRPGARGGPRGAAHAAAAGSGTPTRRHDRPGLLLVTPVVRDLDARRLPGLGRRRAGRAAGAARLASAHLAEELRKGLRVGRPARPGVGARRGQRPRARGRRRGARRSSRSSGRCCGCSARPVGALRLRPDPLGALSFACRGGRGRRDAPRGCGDAGELPTPGRRRAVRRRHPDPRARPPDTKREP